MVLPRLHISMINLDCHIERNTAQNPTGRRRLSACSGERRPAMQRSIWPKKITSFRPKSIHLVVARETLVGSTEPPQVKTSTPKFLKATNWRFNFNEIL